MVKQNRDEMKTLFICASSLINRHLDEEYDDILEVSDEPTTVDIDNWAGIISGRIRRLWASDEGEDDHAVEIYLDGPSPYHVILKNLSLILLSQDNMVLRLPYFNDVRNLDDETQQVLKRLGGRKQIQKDENHG